MFEILTASEMKQVDRVAIEAGTPGFELIKRAGQAAAAQIAESIDPVPVLVICGRGHNGADGFVIAAELAARGWPVRLACLAKVTELKNDVALAARCFEGKIEALNSNLGLKDTQLIIDAVFGTGFQGALDPELVTLFDKIRTKKLPVIAIDVPSGMAATSGDIAEGTLQATLTLTFCRRKVAHMLYPARSFCGRIVKCDIGIGDDMVAGIGSQTLENHPALWLTTLPVPDNSSHKYTRGHAAVFGGTHRTGAAALAALAAQRAGCGVVSILCPPAAVLGYRLIQPSLLVDEWSDEDEFKALVSNPRLSSFVLGPGALPSKGGEEDLRRLTIDVIATHKPVVFDGDIFRAFEHQAPQFFAQLSADKHILTPHAGEFRRMFGTPDGSKLEQARTAAQKANAVIVYKGADTVIAAPDGTAVIDVSGPPTLATAGSGDVLAGLIAGFAAQGMQPFFAACAGVWFQAQSARLHGPGLVAEDIISHIPQVVSDLYAGQSYNL